MFRSRKRSQLDNAANLTQQIPETTVNHYYTSSRAGTIFSLFLVVVATAILGWNGLVFLVERARSNDSEGSAASCLIGLGGIAILMIVMGLAARFFLNDFYGHRERMQDKKVELERVRSRAIQAIPPQVASGMLEEDKRKYRAAIMVMDRAYQAIDDQGRLRIKGEPWSKRGVGDLTILGERKKIGEDSDLAKGMKAFLLERGIILDDRTVNLVRFPDLNTVEAEMITIFGRAIVRYTPGGDEGAMSSHYIEPGTKKESWG